MARYLQISLVIIIKLLQMQYGKYLTITLNIHVCREPLSSASLIGGAFCVAGGATGNCRLGGLIMRDLRCKNCQRLLGRYQDCEKLEIKCPRCGTINIVVSPPESVASSPLKKQSKAVMRV